MEEKEGSGYDVFDNKPVNLLVEYSKSGAASCIFCNEKINKAELRFGIQGRSKFYFTTKYSHFECL